MGRALPAVLVAVGLLAACAGFEGISRGPATDEQRRAFAAATSAVDSDPVAAEARLNEFLEKWPRSPLADDAAMRLAEFALSRGDRDAALTHYTFVIRRHPDGDQHDAARVWAAEIEALRGNAGGAANIMGRVRIERLGRRERLVAYRVLADVVSAPVSRLHWLSRLRADESDADAVALIDVEIDEVLAGVEEDELGTAARQAGATIPAARIELTIAERGLEGGDLGDVRAALERAVALPLAPQYAGRLRTAIERLRLREQGPPDLADLPTFAELQDRVVPAAAPARGTIGVVLPLSGRFARFGEEVLQGVLLAAGVFGARGDPAADSRVRLLIRDSAGRPELAAEAVRELARDRRVVAIIGPLLRGECESAARAAEYAGISLLALTARPEIARERPYVFRLRTMPSEEVQSLIDHAMRDLGALTFAILYPRDAYGRGLRDLFWDGVEERGGEIVSVASYDPDATDFAEPIRRLAGYVLLSDEEKDLLKERHEMRRRARRLPPEEAMALREQALALTGPDQELLPPIVDFDALFLPESHDRVVLIAPQLAFHEVTGTRLLGTNEWYHPDLIAIGRHHVEGAVLTARFFAESPLPYVQRFAQRFEAAFRVAPQAFGAQGFDAANLVLVQMTLGRESREAIRDGVLATRAYPGVTGILSMRADGNAHKRPFLVEVEGGRFVQVE